ncbi:FAD-dependent oxidoreductase [Adlercreutzia equolifaciens]|uniref:FAD-dependent oxidoreductase n=1 Tax=Adlercreutzia equolifaciens TaxID=446660 RepID=UPI0023B08829|nr:FAD-dependent oxidoreductase [Adlercreutzia equolifaciens]MDE8702869.1 FAD-dependent oxidoreductase [Adlercreutzia equolifaciens]
MKTIAIIGGGAAGLTAAIAAAEAARKATEAPGPAPVSVTVYEASDRVGRSILATGNGRCNFSNAVIEPELYRNGAHVAAALEVLEAQAAGVEPSGVSSTSEALSVLPGGPNAVLSFFAESGLVWREEGEGRLYPLANKATSVLDCLRARLEAAGVNLVCDSAVEAIEAPGERCARFTLRLADGRFERADAVIVAVGGRVAPRLLPAGLPFVKTALTLGPLAVKSPYPRQLDNIRVRGALELWRGTSLVARERGEVMFRKYGVSGIAAFNLSRLAQPGDELAVDFLPVVAGAEAFAFLAERACALSAVLDHPATWDDVLRGMVLAPVAEVLLKAASVRGEQVVSAVGASDSADGGAASSDVAAVAAVLKGLRLPVTGIGDERQCQVHRGGVAVEALDAATGRVRAVPGLFVAGEAADVDAPCGGYNLHWAWASGLLAGRGAAAVIEGAHS